MSRLEGRSQRRRQTSKSPPIWLTVHANGDANESFGVTEPAYPVEATGPVRQRPRAVSRCLTANSSPRHATPCWVGGDVSICRFRCQARGLGLRWSGQRCTTTRPRRGLRAGRRSTVAQGHLTARGAGSGQEQDMARLRIPPSRGRAPTPNPCTLGRRVLQNARRRGERLLSSRDRQRGVLARCLAWDAQVGRCHRCRSFMKWGVLGWMIRPSCYKDRRCLQAHRGFPSHPNTPSIPTIPTLFPQT